MMSEFIEYQNSLIKWGEMQETDWKMLQIFACAWEEQS